MLSSPVLSPASSTRSLPTRMPEANANANPASHRSPPAPLRQRFGALHVYMGFLMSAVGAGMLSVPYTLVLVPMWQAVAGILFVAVAMGATANALLHAHVQVAAQAEFEAHALGAGSKFVGFQALARRAGGPALGYAVSVVTASGVYGGCVGNIRIIRDLTPFVLQVLHVGVAQLSEKAQENVEQAVMWGLLVVVVFPLCMLRQLSALKVTNYVSFALSLYLVGAVFYRACEGYTATTSTNTMEASASGSSALEVLMNGSGSFDTDYGSQAGSAAVGVTSNTTADAEDASQVVGSGFARLAQSVSIYNFAFMMTLNLLPLFMELLEVGDHSKFSGRRPGDTLRSLSTFVSAPPLLAARSRMTRCIFGVALTCALLYGALGCAAFELYGSTIDGNVLLNLETDSAMAIPLVALYLTVLFTFPLLFLPLRAILEEVLTEARRPYTELGSSYVDLERNAGSARSVQSAGPRDKRPRRRFDRLLVVMALLCSQQLIALNVPGIEVVFSLLGATSCLVICYIFPVVAFTRVYPWRRVRHGRLWAALLWLIVTLVTVQGVTSVWLLLSSRSVAV